MKNGALATSLLAGYSAAATTSNSNLRGQQYAISGTLPYGSAYSSYGSGGYPNYYSNSLGYNSYMPSYTTSSLGGGYPSSRSWWSSWWPWSSSSNLDELTTVDPTAWGRLNYVNTSPYTSSYYSPSIGTNYGGAYNGGAYNNGLLSSTYSSGYPYTYSSPFASTAATLLNGGIGSYGYGSTPMYNDASIYDTTGTYGYAPDSFVSDYFTRLFGAGEKAKIQEEDVQELEQLYKDLQGAGKEDKATQVQSLVKMGKTAIEIQKESSDHTFNPRVLAGKFNIQLKNAHL